MTKEKSMAAFVENCCNAAQSCGTFPVVDKGPAPQVLGLMLSNVTRTQLASAESVRVAFFVQKVLAEGFGRANFNIEKPPPPGTKRDPNDNLYRLSGTGALVAKSYQLIGKGNKGPPSERGGCIMSGMVLQISVFKDQFASVFGEGEAQCDLPMFSQAIIALQSRSMASKQTTSGGLLQLRSVKPWAGPLVFGGRGLQASLLPTSIEDSVKKRMDFLDSERLTSETGFAVDQDYVCGLLSQTRHCLRLQPSAGECDLGRNADGTLYVQLANTVGKVGVDIGRVRLHDAGGYLRQLGTPDWVENLLRFALAREALSVLLVYDSMRQGMDAESQIVDGMCYIDMHKLLSMCIKEAPIESKEGLDDPALADVMIPPSATWEDFAVFDDDDEDVDEGKQAYTVVSKKACKQAMVRLRWRENGTCASAGAAKMLSGSVTWDPVISFYGQAVHDGDAQEPSGDGPVWLPILCEPQHCSLWKIGHIVRIFQEGRMVLYFVMPEQSACLGLSGSKRTYNDMDVDGLAGFM